MTCRLTETRRREWMKPHLLSVSCNLNTANTKTSSRLQWQLQTGQQVWQSHSTSSLQQTQTLDKESCRPHLCTEVIHLIKVFSCCTRTFWRQTLPGHCVSLLNLTAACRSSSSEIHSPHIQKSPLRLPVLFGLWPSFIHKNVTKEFKEEFQVLLFETLLKSFEFFYTA